MHTLRVVERSGGAGERAVTKEGAGAPGWRSREGFGSARTQGGREKRCGRVFILPIYYISHILQRPVGVGEKEGRGQNG